MIGENILQKLRRLSSDLVLVDTTSPLDEWQHVAKAAEELAGLFLQEAESEAMETANHIADVAKTLSKGIIANPEAGVKAIQSLIGVLQDLDGGPGIIESHRKQAVAEANLFFRDAKKEESRVTAATTFEDDEEQREMIMAIEQRIDELEADLLALNPHATVAYEVRSIFRQFHTLKGEGAICGIKSVADFCHGIETEIEDARSGGLVLTNEIVSVLQELSAILRPILAGESREEIGESLIESLMEELRLAVIESKEAGVPGEAAAGEAEESGEDKFADFFSGFEPPPARDEVEEEEAERQPSDDIHPVDETEQALLGLLTSIGEEHPAAPEVADPAKPSETAAIRQEEARELAEHLSAADFLDAILAGDAGEEGGKESAAETAPEPAARPRTPTEKPSSGVALKKPRPAAGDTVIESGDLAGSDTHVKPSSTAIARGEIVEKKVEDTKVKAISVDVNRLDDLLEIVGEVSLIGSYVTTQLQGMENLSLQTTNLVRACARLQEVANSMRMTSIRPLFMTVRRAAADAARASRKMIDINMTGIDTQVDRSIVESLSAALIHIIRNAVDHGIETADVRRRAGKPERGVITVSAMRTNADIVIELGDDGKGFDLKAIHDKAVAMGKIAPEATLSNEELADLVFLPGLSTAKRITGLSGRGWGWRSSANPSTPSGARWRSAPSRAKAPPCACAFRSWSPPWTR